MARVSSSPGKTQTINFYSFRAKKTTEKEPLRHTFYAVDLPGYGFARTSQSQKNQWSAFICKYMENSRDLKLVCILMDIRHAPMESDIDCYQWLLSLGIPLMIILTKSDKLNKGAVAAQKELYKKTFGLDDDRILTYTSTAHTNRRELIERIFGYVGTLNPMIKGRQQGIDILCCRPYPFYLDFRRRSRNWVRMRAVMPQMSRSL